MTESPGMNAVSLATVATAAGVSQSTASRAFTSPKMLAPATRQRILATATELGYRPNYVGRALATGRTMSLGMVVPDIANPFFPPIIKAAQQTSRSAGYSLMIANGNEDPKEEQRVVERLGQQVDGLILCSPRARLRSIEETALTRPVVLVNRVARDLPSVLVESSDALADAVDHLFDLGHRMIAYVRGPHRSWSNQERLEALAARCRKHGISLVTVGEGVLTRNAGLEAGVAAIQAGATATVAFDDLLAVGVLSALAEQGLKVPDDHSVIGCDDVLSDFTTPRLTSIGGVGTVAGRAAVEMLLQLIDDKTETRRRLSLSARLTIRATTGPRAKGVEVLR